MSLSKTEIKLPPIAIDLDEVSIFKKENDVFPFWEKRLVEYNKKIRKHLNFII